MAVNKDKVFLFKVNMKLARGRPQIYREMVLKGESSLRDFAKTITGAFDFNLDHAYGFYNNMNCIYDSSEAYTSFKDEGGSIQPNERSARNSCIHEVFKAGKKMLFYFDFGEQWEFIVECRCIVEAEVGKSYPAVTKSHGEAPPQYILPSDEEFSDEECSNEEESEGIEIKKEESEGIEIKKEEGEGIDVKKGENKGIEVKKESPEEEQT